MSLKPVGELGAVLTERLAMQPAHTALEVAAFHRARMETAKRLPGLSTR